MNRKTLFVTLTKQEARLGLGLLVLYWVLPGNLVTAAVLFAASVVLLRRFLWESARMPLMPMSRILWKAALAVLAVQVVTTLMNDLFLPFFPEYFIYGETGPAFFTVHKAALAADAGERFLPAFLRAALLVPAAEELLYRGVLFGTLYHRAGWPAYPVTALLYALVFTAPLIGAYPASFVILHFLQTLPMSMIFCWVYASGDSILIPLLAHIVLNAMSVLSMR